MYIAIDIILIAVMAATVYRAARRGFVVSVFGLCSVAAALFAAWVFSPELGIYINEEYMRAYVSQYVYDFVENMSAQSGDFGADALLSELPEGLLSTAKTLGIDIAAIFGGAHGAAETMAENIASTLSSAISNILAFAILFFAVFVLLKLLCAALDRFAELPVLKTLNTFLGIVFGVLEAFVLGILIAELSVSLCDAYGTLNGAEEFLEVAEKTVVAKFLTSIFPW